MKRNCRERPHFILIRPAPYSVALESDLAGLVLASPFTSHLACLGLRFPMHEVEVIVHISQGSGGHDEIARGRALGITRS